MPQMNYSIQRPSISSLSRWASLSILVVLQGCSTRQKNIDSQFDANAEVRIQVCLPTKKVYFNDLVVERLENHPLFTKYSQRQLELAPKTIRRVASASDPKAIQVYGVNFGEVLIRNGQFSDGSGFMPLHDSTVTDQPVFERGYGYPAKNYVAMHLSLPDLEKGPDGRVIFWFTLPKSIPYDRFTDWFKPISMEPEGQRLPGWWKLTHGGDLALYPVNVDPPMMRVSFKKRHVEHNDPTTDNLPALTTARRRFKIATSEQQFLYEFVPMATEAIPACD